MIVVSICACSGLANLLSRSVVDAEIAMLSFFQRDGERIKRIGRNYVRLASAQRSAHRICSSLSLAPDVAEQS